MSNSLCFLRYEDGEAVLNPTHFYFDAQGFEIACKSYRTVEGRFVRRGDKVGIRIYQPANLVEEAEFLDIDRKGIVTEVHVVFDEIVVIRGISL